MKFKHVGPFKRKHVSYTANAQSTSVVYEVNNTNNQQMTDAFLPLEPDPDSTVIARPNGKFVNSSPLMYMLCRKTDLKRGGITLISCSILLLTVLIKYRPSFSKCSFIYNTTVKLTTYLFSFLFLPYKVVIMN